MAVFSAGSPVSILNWALSQALHINLVNQITIIEIRLPAAADFIQFFIIKTFYFLVSQDHARLLDDLFRFLFIGSLSNFSFQVRL